VIFERHKYLFDWTPSSPISLLLPELCILYFQDRCRSPYCRLHASYSRLNAFTLRDTKFVSCSSEARATDRFITHHEQPPALIASYSWRVPSIHYSPTPSPGLRPTYFRRLPFTAQAEVSIRLRDTRDFMTPQRGPSANSGLQFTATFMQRIGHAGSYHRLTQRAKYTRH